MVAVSFSSGYCVKHFTESTYNVTDVGQDMQLQASGLCSRSAQQERPAVHARHQLSVSILPSPESPCPGNVPLAIKVSPPVSMNVTKISPDGYVQGPITQMI